MDTTNTTAASQPGFFGTFTNQLSQLANSAAPLVSAIKGQTGSTKAPTTNASPAAGMAQGTVAGLPMKTILIIGGIVVVVIGAIFFLRK